MSACSQPAPSWPNDETTPTTAETGKVIGGSVANQNAVAAATPATGNPRIQRTSPVWQDTSLPAEWAQQAANAPPGTRILKTTTAPGIPGSAPAAASTHPAAGTPEQPSPVDRLAETVAKSASPDAGAPAPQAVVTQATPPKPKSGRGPSARKPDCLVVADRQGRVPAALLNALANRQTPVRVAASLPEAMVRLAQARASFVIVVDPLLHPSASRQMEFVQAVRSQMPGTAVWGFTQQAGQGQLQPLDRMLGPDGQLCRWRSLMVHSQTPAATASLPQQPLVTEQELAMLLAPDTTGNAEPA